MVRGLLEAGTYKPRDLEVHEQKRKNAFRNMCLMYAFCVAALLAIAFAWFAAHDVTGTIVAIVFFLVSCGVAAWGTRGYYKKARYGYDIVDGAVRIEFDSLDYYVPPNLMEPFLKGILHTFREEFQRVYGKEPKDVIQVLMVVKKERPEDPLKRVSADRVVGLTYHGQRVSYVYGPYALSDGGLGYEFRLQLCHKIVPEMSEPEKIEWMAEKGLYP